MAKTKQQKVVILTDVVRSFQNAKGMVFANFQGLKTTATNELRAKCRENNLNYLVMKKTLLKRALSDIGLNVDTKSFAGGVSIITGSDEVAPAQVVAAFAKTNDKATVFGGVLEGQFIDAQKVTALSKLPSKQQLLGQLVGTINAPVSGFVNVLAGNIRGLVTVLNAVKDQKTA
jgi:large subunit ribosomal protein L10